MADSVKTQSKTQRPRPRPKMKRKRPRGDDGEPGSGANKLDVGRTESSKPKDQKEKNEQRRAKKQKKRRERQDEVAAAADAVLDYDLGISRAFAAMDAAQLADHLGRQTRRFGTQLSPVELADLQLGPAPIVNTTSFAQDRTLDHLPAFLEAFCDGGKAHLASAPPSNGSPHTIIVTGAGLRAADLVRAVRPFQTANSTVSKLFAKHIKLAEAVAFLQSHRTGIAVGTPARLIDLLKSGALSVAHLRRLVVDASHIDQKKRGVLDMPDTALPVAQWLAQPEFRARYGGDDKQPLSVLFY